MEFNKPYSPQIIVDNNIHFRIPLYQRPYTWTEVQISQFICDLWDSYNNSKDNPYFIGIMNISSTNYDNYTFDLIDGQQRITTLSVMALELKKYFEKFTNLCGWVDFYGREDDKIFLKDGISKENTNKNLVTAREIIISFLEDKNIDNKKEFAEYVFSKASFFLCLIPQNYTIIDKNKMFVRMNNRGKQLRMVDILKERLSSVPGLEPKDFLDKWNEISQMNCQESINKIKNNDSTNKNTINNIINKPAINIPKEFEIYYQSIVTFDVFLLIALERMNRNNISYDPNKILQTFNIENDNNKWNKDSVNKFICILENQFKLFCEYFIRRDKEDKFKWQNLKNENIDLDNLNNNRDNKDWNIIRQFQSYLYVSREPHRWMKDAFDWLETENVNDFSPSAFLNKLKDIDNEYAKVLINQNKDYKKKYPNVNRYWFWRLDYYLWEITKKLNGEVKEDRYICFLNLNNEEKKIIENYVFSNNRSVEHLHPKNENNEGKWSGADADMIDSFGNLAMISQTLNTYQSNKSIQEKFGKIEKAITDNKSVESLKLYWMYLTYKMKCKWDADMAKQHQDEMFGILDNSLPEAIKKKELNDNP